MIIISEFGTFSDMRTSGHLATGHCLLRTVFGATRFIGFFLSKQWPVSRRMVTTACIGFSFGHLLIGRHQYGLSSGGGTLYCTVQNYTTTLAGRGPSRTTTALRLPVVTTYSEQTNMSCFVLAFTRNTTRVCFIFIPAVLEWPVSRRKWCVRMRVRTFICKRNRLLDAFIFVNRMRRVLLLCC